MISTQSFDRSSSLESTSLDRKIRLEALKSRKEGNANPILRFRNYDPTSRDITKSINVEDTYQETVENAVKGLSEEILKKDEDLRNEELDIMNIAPKRPNWDLKRELDKKMSILNKVDQLAINTLIKQRLTTSSNNDKPNVSLNSKPGLINYGNNSDSDDD